MKKWTYEACYSEAKKYKTGGEFSKYDRTCYEISRRNGWINDYTWLKRNHARNSWTKESCYNEAKKYKTKSEFASANGSVYTKALRNGWLNDYVWFEGNIAWDYDLCYEEAKKCHSRKEFHSINASAYHKAKKEGWLEDYDWFKKRPVSDKPEYVVYEYKDDTTKTVYVGLTRQSRLDTRDNEHRNGILKHGIKLYDTVYKYFSEMGVEIPKISVLKTDLYASDAQYYEEYYANFYKDDGFNVLNKVKPGSLGAVIKWTEELCKEEAQKYKTLKEFRTSNRSCYETARRNGWVKNYEWLQRQCCPKNTWTYEKCYEIATECKTVTEFTNISRGAYTAAIRNGWFEDYSWIKRGESRLINYWDYEKCKVEAIKYKTRSEFHKECSSAYKVSNRNKWLDEFFPRKIK